MPEAVIVSTARTPLTKAHRGEFNITPGPTLAAFAVRPGFLRGRVGRAADEPTAWVLTTEWEGVGAYRRALSSYDVKMTAPAVMAYAVTEPSAFEVLGGKEPATDR